MENNEKTRLITDEEEAVKVFHELIERNPRTRRSVRSSSDR